MERIKRVQTLTIPNTDTASSAFLVDDMAFGAIEMPATIDGTEYAIEGRLEAGGSWREIYDSSGSALAAITHVADKIIRLPDEVFACLEIRFVTNSSQTATRTIKAMAKS